MLTVDEARTRGTATVEQRTELHALLKDRAVEPGWVQRFYTSVRRVGGLSHTAATDALIYLKSLAAAGMTPHEATGAQRAAMQHLRRTRIVPARIATKILKQQADGQLSYGRADVIIREWLRLPYRDHALLEDTTVSGAAPDGYFALLAPDGLPRCYRIHTLPGTGTRIVQQITGDKPSQRRPLKGPQAQQVMHQVAADVPAAARRFGEVRHRCSNCNNHLEREDQPGFPHGYGPDCWAAIQAAAQPTPAKDPA